MYHKLTWSLDNIKKYSISLCLNFISSYALKISLMNKTNIPYSQLVTWTDKNFGVEGGGEGRAIPCPSQSWGRNAGSRARDENVCVNQSLNALRTEIQFNGPRHQ